MSDAVRVGVIGAGVMGRYHCETLARRLPGAELVAVADVDEDAARRAAGRAPAAAGPPPPPAVLGGGAGPGRRPPPLTRGPPRAEKHVFGEKPVALDLASADASLAEAARRGVKLQVGFQRRFDPAYLEARQGVAGGGRGV